MDIIEKLAAVVGSDIQFSPAKCLHTTNRASTCNRCVAFCSTGAISAGPPIAHNPERCVKCGLCLHTCPTGAYEGDDGRANLLAHVAAVTARGDVAVLEFACKYHPSPEAGPPADAVLRVPGCLGLLSPSALVAAALGAPAIRLRLERCQNCPMGHAQCGIEESVRVARELFAAVGAPGEVELVTAESAADGWESRPVRDAAGPVFSRKGLFRAKGGEAPQTVGHALAAEGAARHLDIPRERLRLLLALERLPYRREHLPAELGFALMEVSGDCTACGVCARVCPTDALRMLKDDEGAFYLTFRAGACVGCDACLTYCEPGVLTSAGAPTLERLLDPDPVVLASGSLRVCQKCGIEYADPEGSTLCSLCEFRRKNPFGSRRPERSRRQAVGAKAESGFPSPRPESLDNN